MHELLRERVDPQVDRAEREAAMRTAIEAGEMDQVLRKGLFELRERRSSSPA